MTVPDTAALTIGQNYTGENDEETALVRRMVQDSISYLLDFDWCHAVVEAWVGLAVPSVLTVVLLQVDGDDDVDEWLWVIVGDLPSAYIEFDPEFTVNAACALDSYVGNMQHWADAVEEGRSLQDEYPVAADPTLEVAQLLRRRLQFIDDEILSQYSEELRRGAAGSPSNGESGVDAEFPPAVVDPTLVGTYPALAKSGGGFVWDGVLEYRVWVHPERGGADVGDGSDYFVAFATYSEALAFSRGQAGAEEPLALVLQEEYIDESEPGQYSHRRDRRITEWPVAFLRRPRRTAETIPNFLAPDAPSNRLDILRGL